MSSNIPSNTWDQMSQQVNQVLSPKLNSSIDHTPQRNTPNPRERDAAFAREQQIAVKETARRYEQNIQNNRPKQNGYKVTEPENKEQGLSNERKPFEKRIPLVWFVVADVQTFPVDGHTLKITFPALIKSGKTGQFTVGYGGGNKVFEIDEVILKLLEYIFTTTTFSNVKALSTLSAGIAKASSGLEGTLTSFSVEQVESLLSLYILRGACALLQMRQICYKIDFGNIRTVGDRVSQLTPEMESNMNILRKFAANGVMAYFALYNSFLFPSLAHASGKNLDVYLSSLDCEITDRIKIREFVFGRIIKYATKRLYKQYNTAELIDTDSLEASNKNGSYRTLE